MFCQRKTLYINCVHNGIFSKIWGGQMHYWPPRVIWGGHGPLAPPVADPMIIFIIIQLSFEVLFSRLRLAITINSHTLLTGPTFYRGARPSRPLCRLRPCSVHSNYRKFLSKIFFLK